jgi:nucleoside-diphosphate-sugar epimerase
MKPPDQRNGPDRTAPPFHRRSALVTGATGAVGPALVRLLLEQDYRVRALVRRRCPTIPSPEAIEVSHGEIDDGNAVRNAMDGIEVVFHLAAKLHIANPGPDLRDEYKRVNVEGTRSVVRAAQHVGAQRLVFFSTINVYGSSRPGEVLDEGSPLRPDSWYAETKAEAERIVLEGTPAVVLRPAAVYGPGMKGNYRRLAAAVRRRRFIPIGRGDNRRTLIYVNDLASAALLAGNHAGAAGQILNATDGQIHTLRQILEATYRSLGRRPPPFHVPLSAACAGARLVERAAEMVGGEPPITRSAIATLAEDVAVSGAKLKRELGFLPQYDLLGGWRETMQVPLDGR